MPRESATARAQRLHELLLRLPRLYPDAHCELQHRNPLELLVATILSAQCTDQRVNQVTPALFARYPDAAAYAQAPLPELENAIRSTGFFRNKARHLQACGRQLVAEHAGQVPASLAALTQLQGVGRKTANVILGNAFGRNDGVVVDTHVARLARRLGLTRHTHPEKIEQDLMRQVPRDQWTLFSHWLIWHGRRRCHARRPHCAACELASLCPTSTPPAAPPTPP